MNLTKKVFLLSILFGMASMASALIRPDIRIIGYAIEPELIPGGSAQMQIQLANVGNDECAYRVNIQITPNTPLSVQGTDTQYMDRICKNSGPQNVTFTLLADQSASLGNNPVSMSVNYESEYAAPYVTSQSATVQVKGTTHLAAFITSSTPLDVHPGDAASIQVTLDNQGTANAEDAQASLQLPIEVEVKSNSQTQIVSELSAKKSTVLTYFVFVPKTAAPKNYPGTLHVQYVDEYGKRQSADLPVTLTVKPKALFTAVTQDGKLFAGSNNIVVRFGLTNTGKGSAKKLRVKLIPQYPFSTDGSERYIEELAPGQSDHADFTVDVDKQASIGNYALQLQANYEDDQGQSQQDPIDVNLNVPQKDLFTAIFIDYWFVWIIALVVALFVLRGRLANGPKPKENKK